jgi:hypothetical protein
MTSLTTRDGAVLTTFRLPARHFDGNETFTLEERPLLFSLRSHESVVNESSLMGSAASNVVDLKIKIDNSVKTKPKTSFKGQLAHKSL